jgi:D-alanyl-D-alanine carboxypeptidase (penicillin-binding protein 5/6)
MVEGQMRIRAVAPVLALLLLLGLTRSLAPATALAQDGGGQAVSVSTAGGSGSTRSLGVQNYINLSGDQLGISAQAYLVYDLNASKPVALYNLEREQPIASLTKLMTAILACDKLRFDGRYILTPAEAKTFGVPEMRADKMLEMALIPSNNEVCKVIARLVAGSEAKFAVLMNQRAAELGMKHTHFINSNGLPGAGQHSTPYDVALLGRAALAYDRIRAAMSESDVELNGKVYKGTLHDLRARHCDPRTGCLVAGKTGYTNAAGRCLCLLYEARGHQYLVVTFHSSGVKASFRDAEQLLSVCGLYDGDVGAWQ